MIRDEGYNKEVMEWCKILNFHEWRHQLLGKKEKDVEN